MRAHFEAKRPASDDNVIESHLELRDGDDLLPGYGWIFPMGEGRINVGVGILSTYKGWQKVNNAHLMDAYIRLLPRGVGAAGHLRRSARAGSSRAGACRWGCASSTRGARA